MSNLLLTINLLVALPLFLPAIDSARILAYPLDFSFDQHCTNMLELSEILMGNGHDVIFLTNKNCMPKKRMPESLVLFTYALPANISIELNKTNSYQSARYGSKAAIESCANLLSREDIILQLNYHDIDLFITDCSNFCARVLIDYLQIPTILWCNRISEIEHIQPFSMSYAIKFANQSLLNGLIEVVNSIFFHSIYLPRFVYGPLDGIKRERYYNTTFSIATVYSRAMPLVLLNADFSYELPIPLSPHIIPIPGILAKEPMPLPVDIEEFITSSNEHGVVVVDFTSISDIIDHTRSLPLVKTLAKLQQKIIWRSPGVYHLRLPDNTWYLPMLSGVDTISHPKIRLLVSDCGNDAISAAFKYAVPILCVPFFSTDWHDCTQVVRRKGIGKVLDLSVAKDDELEAAVWDLLDKEAYKKNSIKLARVISDQLIRPKDRLLYWVNYVIRHQGASHLHNDFHNSWIWGTFHMEAVLLILFIFIISWTCLFLLCFCYFWTSLFGLSVSNMQKYKLD